MGYLPRASFALSASLVAGCFSASGSAIETDTEGATLTDGQSSQTGGTSNGPSGSPTSETSATTDTDSTTEGPTSETTIPDDDDSTSTDEDTDDEVVILECVEGLVDPATGTPATTINTLPLTDDSSGSCGGVASRDAAFQWIAPFSNFFVFDTQGSDFDTVLYLRDNDCDGEELACNVNRDDGVVFSRLVAPFEAGEQVVVVVDGNAGEAGNAVLNINPVTCPNADLTNQPLPATFSTVSGTNSYASSCGGDGNLERSFRYTAPEAGLYSFRATSSAFTPIVSVHDGPECGAPLLQCNRSPGQVGAEVFRNLEAGQSVTVVVDSNSGSGQFQIDIQPRTLTCPRESLGATAFHTFAGNISDYDAHMTTSCAPAGEAFGETVTPHRAVTLSWTSPGMVGSSSGCDITYIGGFPAALSLQEGDQCAASELECILANVDATEDRYTQYLSIGHIPATDFTITIVQSQQNLVPIFNLNFELQISCYAVG